MNCKPTIQITENGVEVQATGITVLFTQAPDGALVVALDAIPGTVLREMSLANGVEVELVLSAQADEPSVDERISKLQKDLKESVSAKGKKAHEKKAAAAKPKALRKELTAALDRYNVKELRAFAKKANLVLGDARTKKPIMAKMVAYAETNGAPKAWMAA